MKPFIIIKVKFIVYHIQTSVFVLLYRVSMVIDFKESTSAFKPPDYKQEVEFKLNGVKINDGKTEVC